MRVHFIAIGGAVMHNLAITLHKKGYQVTGSDDEIFEPSRSRLLKYGLLPVKNGWNADIITEDIDVVILGMHARNDNPELIRARERKIRIMSFPEYLYDQTRNKKRIVVAGSHGKTTTTAMIMHVFRHLGIKFDYMVGSMIDGFETMVGLHDDSEIAVFEGDEYLTSALDKRPKFHLYVPDIAIINGIAWDHMNVFPTFEDYILQFKIFTEKISQNGSLIYFIGDNEVKRLVEKVRTDIKKIPYNIHPYYQDEDGFCAITDKGTTIPLKIFGEHNMQNMSAAREACRASGIKEEDFYKAMQSFEGTSKRLQKIKDNNKGIVYTDFAHSPSKVKATVEAIVARYPGRNVIACFELHTYSSLNKNFLAHYKNTLASSDIAFVYFNPHAIKMKKLELLTTEEVKDAFGSNNIHVYNDSKELLSRIKELNYPKPVYLFMSSGDFDGFDPESFLE
jgi:UDP-N-acetylmuramate: L-alanyl-gamma-D-glutamyl-meso-diaminopimelate ligase